MLKKFLPIFALIIILATSIQAMDNSGDMVHKLRNFSNQLSVTLKCTLVSNTYKQSEGFHDNFLKCEAMATEIANIFEKEKSLLDLLAPKDVQQFQHEMSQVQIFKQQLETTLSFEE